MLKHALHKSERRYADYAFFSGEYARRLQINSFFLYQAFDTDINYGKKHTVSLQTWGDNEQPQKFGYQVFQSIAKNTAFQPVISQQSSF